MAIVKGYPEYATNAVIELKVAMVNRLKKRKDVPSLWNYFFPEELAHSRDIICLKWFQGKATMFDAESFSNLLAFFETSKQVKSLSSSAKLVLEFLEESSPHSTREIKQATDMVGPLYAKAFNLTLKELWQIGLIVSWGKVDKAAFPSVSIGSSRQLFEDCWNQAIEIPCETAKSKLADLWGEESAFLKFAEKIKSQREKQREKSR